nr:ribonuclease H-like domain-containing protein [Tanacetum cinerariifolium]
MVINSPCLTNKKELAILGQTTTRKELSNLLMAGSLPKTICQIDDVEGTSCLTNTEIFEGLARMSAKTTSWNEFSSTMASSIICLATNQKFNFSRYILLSLVKNIEAGVPFFMFPRVGIRFSREVTKLFDNMLVQAPKEVGILQVDAQPIHISTEPSTSKRQKKHKPMKKHTKEPEVPPTESQAKHNVPLPSPSHDPLPSGEDSLKLKELMDLCTNLSNKVLDLESEVIEIKSTYKEKIEKLESKVLSMLDVNNEEPAGVEEVLEVVKDAKLITKVVTTTRVDVNAASVQDTPITVDLISITSLSKSKTLLDKLVHKSINSLSFKLSSPLGSGSWEGEDEEVTRQLKAELNADINWNVVIKQVKRSERLTDVNMDGYKMNYFKGMSYDEIRPLFEKYYNYNQAFLNEVNEGIKVPKKEVRQEKEIEVESTKREDATPLAFKIPIVDYKIHTKRNRPYFKIIRADGIHRLFMSFSTILKNFNREDLESLWKIVRERFEKTEPKNYSDDYLLSTFKIIFEKPNVEANVWKDQKGKYGLAKVISWKLLDSCGVHCLNLSTTQIFLLVEKMYPLIHFTLEQMIVPDDDVYTDATPLAFKIPIVDYKIHTKRNRPYFKIIRADGIHRLFMSFSTILKNFNREDLESLWKIVRERFEKTEPKNYSDDYLLSTFKIIFEKPNVEANVWKDQKGKYGLAKVISWKLLDSCGVHCLNLSTTQIFLLVEKMCLITILNTIDHLGKFNGKADEGSEPDWLFDIDALTRTMSYDPIGVVNVVGENISIELQIDPNKPALEDISIFDSLRDDKDDGSKWVFRNKKDEKGTVIRNKARLVSHEYTQEEGIDYDEVFAPLVRIEAIRLFLAYASFKDFVVYQMEVKSAFLYRKIKEEVSKDCKHTYGTRNPLLKDEDGKEVDVHMYRSMIGSLMYLTSSRPDIMFVVCTCARHQVNPKVYHLHVVKRIFRYLKDGKEIVIIESFVKRDLQLADEEDEVVHKELGNRFLRATTIASSLEAEQDNDEVVHKELGNRFLRATTIASSLEAEQDNGGSRSLKKNKSRTHKLKRLYKVGLSARLESSIDKESLGEDASKQRGRIDAIDADEDITLLSIQDDADKEMFNVDTLGGEEMFVAGKK